MSGPAPLTTAGTSTRVRRRSTFCPSSSEGRWPDCWGQEARSLTAPTPKISGTVRVGKTLTAKVGTWKPSGVSLKYQWYRGGKGRCRCHREDLQARRHRQGQEDQGQGDGRESRLHLHQQDVQGNSQSQEERGRTAPPRRPRVRLRPPDIRADRSSVDFLLCPRMTTIGTRRRDAGLWRSW